MSKDSYLIEQLKKTREKMDNFLTKVAMAGILTGVPTADKSATLTSTNSNDAGAKKEIVTKTKSATKVNSQDHATMNVLLFFEGFSENPYPDKKNIWTIGVGLTEINGKVVTSKTKLSKQQLIEGTKNHVSKKVDKYIKQYIKVPLNENQRAALTSMIYNCGDRVLHDKNGNPSKLAKAINSQNKNFINMAFMEYNKISKKDKKTGKKTIKNDAGLTIRRAMEYNIFCGNISASEISDFVVCQYANIDSKLVTKQVNGKLMAKTDTQTIKYIKNKCTEKLAYEQQKEWFGGNNSVGNYTDNMLIAQNVNTTAFVKNANVRS